jgi:hypothetical protein
VQVVTLKDITISDDNQINNNVAGIRFSSSATLSGTQAIEGNTVSYNSDYGIGVFSDNDMLISENKIFGNTNYGVTATFEVDATHNWWGAPSGPTYTGNLCGTGDDITDNVLYDCWKGDALLTMDVCQLQAFTLSGTTSICISGNAILTLSGSQLGTGFDYLYDLYADNVLVPSETKIGTGSALTWTVYPSSNINYTVKARNSFYACELPMTGSAKVYIGPITSVPVLLACPGTQVDVPITVTGFEDVGAISLTLNFNPAVMQYASYSDNSGLIDFLEANNTTGVIRFSGTPVPPAELADGAALLTLTFNYISGNTSLTWDDSDDTWCEYGSYDPDFIPFCDDPASTYYIDGSVSQQTATEITAAEMQASVGNPAGPWNWGVSGTFNNYSMCIDPLEEDYYYMDIETLSATVPLATGFMNPFYLSQASGDLPPGWTAYWTAKGVVLGATGWQGVMYDIITGAEPIFYIYLNGTDYQLIDGLLYQYASTMSPLRVEGTYPQWNYKYSGQVKDNNGCFSSMFDILMQFNSSPVVTDVTMLTSIDMTNWSTVNGDFDSGFEMCIDPAIPYHYLDIDAFTGPVNALLVNDFIQNAFYLDETSVPTGFWAYWAAKGVDGSNNSQGWELTMWDIINGVDPMFYIKYTGSDYQLIDGLQWQIGQGAQTLRISGDYPQGNYKFSGTVTDVNYCVSSFFDVFIEFNTSPVVTNVTLLTSTNLSNWAAVGGNFGIGFEMCIDPVIPYHYLDIDALSATGNPLLANVFVQNAFYLDETTVPTGFWTYWAAKGVVSGATGWQGVMWQIINGNAPIFYIKYTGTDYQLIDGLQFQIGSGENPLRISGDYPQGTYKFSGTVTDVNLCVSSFFDVFLELNSSPVVTDVTLFTSIDQTNWSTVSGDFDSGFEMCIDPVIPYHYLDINTLTGPANALLANDFIQNAFYLDETTVPTGFWTYWSDKGVVTGATGWQGVMWQIINGNAPIFYIKYTGTDYQLIDGLQYQIGSGENPLRISGDYPQGIYKFSGTVTDVNYCVSSFFDVFIEFNSSPVVTDVTLLTSTDETNWSAVGGTFATNFEMCIDPVIPYHYLDINMLTSTGNPLLANDFIQNAFYLDETSVPTGFFSYWAAKGVISGATGWQGVMWQIINGNAPIFYILYTGTDYQLIDGLQWQAFNVQATLRISGDYPQGTYKFSGTVTDVNLCVSSFFDVFLELNSSPVVTDVTLLTSTDETNWSDVDGDFNNGFEMCIDPIIPYHYLDINTFTGPANALLANAFVQNAFYLDVTSVPAGFWTYWAAKGVVFGATGWQGVMWQIINGNAPIFYILYTGADYKLIDGLQYQIGQGAQTLRISGDYPQGNYVYEGTVTDINGCVSSEFDVSIALNTIPALAITKTNVTCHGADDGTINLTVTGTAPFTYIWTDGISFGSTDEDLTGLAPGTYSVTVTDANGCVSSTSATITQPEELSAGYSYTNITCYGAENGTITVYNPLGGYGTYEVSIGSGWNIITTSYSFSDLVAGTYILQLRDAAQTSCITTLGNVNITEPGLLDAVVVSTNVTCNQSRAYDGTITISNPTGGYGTYEVSIGTGWVTLNTSYTFENLTPGAYDVYIRDKAYTSCYVFLEEVTIIEPAILSATTTSTNITCNGANNGQITISNPTGGWGTYEASIGGTWYPVVTSYTFTSLMPGPYTVTLRDAAYPSCSMIVGQKTIVEPAVLNASVAYLNVTCNGANDGQIIISDPTGGWGTYEYRLDAGTWQSSSLFENLAPATYSVQVRDAAYTDCFINLGNQTITEPLVLSATVSETDVTCNSSNNGTITVSNPLGGYGTYQVSIGGNWYTVVSTYTFTGLAPNSYTVTIRDAAHTACEIELAIIIISEPIAIPLSGTVNYYNTAGTPIQNATVYLDQNGAQVYSVNLGSGGTYAFPNVCPGTYEVRIEKAMPVGSINSTDAAQVNFWATTGTKPSIERVRFFAGDVQGDGFDPDNNLNSTDALLIQQYFVTSGTTPFHRDPWSFWKTNDFVNANPTPYYGTLYPTITVNSGDVSVSQNFWGMVTGDYNRSYTPTSKAWSETMQLVYAESLLIGSEMTFELPLKITSAKTIGAVSLILNFPAELVEVIGVSMPNTGGQLDWAVSGDELRIGWNTQNPISLEAMDELLSLQLHSTSKFIQGQEIRFTLAADPLNELADAILEVIPDVVLSIDVVESTTYGLPDPSIAEKMTLVSQPNPFAEYTYLIYNLPVEGHVTLQLTDMLGKRVALLVDHRQIAGEYRLKVDALPLQPGVYTATLLLDNSQLHLIRTLKVVRNR